MSSSPTRRSPPSWGSCPRTDDGFPKVPFAARTVFGRTVKAPSVSPKPTPTSSAPPARWDAGAVPPTPWNTVELSKTISSTVACGTPKSTAPPAPVPTVAADTPRGISPLGNFTIRPRKRESVMFEPPPPPPTPGLSRHDERLEGDVPGAAGEEAALGLVHGIAFPRHDAHRSARSS